jgi:hypothetical protein
VKKVKDLLIDSHVHFDVKGYDIAGIEKEYVEIHGREKWQKLQEMNRYQREKWARPGVPAA